MTRALLITEGKDDVRALREIFNRELGFAVQRNQSPVFSRFEETLTATEPDCRLVVFAAGDRERAARRAKELINEGKLTRNGFARLGLSFDPDGDDEAGWRSWIDRQVLEDAWEIEQGPLDYRITTDTGTICLIPVPWDAGPGFDELDEARRCIERVAIGVMHKVSDEDSALVLKLLEIMQESGRSTSWKTAFRLLNAIRMPNTEDGFVARVFGQDRELRRGVRPVLESTDLWDRLQMLAGRIRG